ncbi:MAG TPA: sulfurtransferase [Nocardioidaceae bacterium]|nr:sulfurtransferase [Nocardioidaceae bacterium]
MRPLTSASRLRTDLVTGPGPASVALLDVRWSLSTGPDRGAYAAGHLPGAAFVDLETALAGPPGARGRHPLPDPTRFVASMRAAGVSNDRRVVVYDDIGGIAAARAWWLLRHYGHRGVQVLDGGWSAWRRHGGAVQTGTPDIVAGDFHGGPGAMPVVDAEEAASLAAAGALVDVRVAERFRGEQEPVDPVAGHIPGARNIPAPGSLTADGLFHPADVLRERFAGVSEARVGAYCGSGVTAAHTVLALEVVGIEAALYPGSWSEWIADADRPVAVGD